MTSLANPRQGTPGEDTSSHVLLPDMEAFAIESADDFTFKGDKIDA